MSSWARSKQFGLYIYATDVYNCVYNCVYDCVYDCVVSFTTAPKRLRLDIPAVEGGRRGKTDVVRTAPEKVSWDARVPQLISFDSDCFRARTARDYFEASGLLREKAGWFLDMLSGPRTALQGGWLPPGLLRGQAGRPSHCSASRPLGLLHTVY